MSILNTEFIIFFTKKYDSLTKKITIFLIW